MARLSTATPQFQLHQGITHVAVTHFAPPLSATYQNIALESSVWPRGLAAAFKARDVAIGCPDGAFACSLNTNACCLNGQYCTLNGGIDLECYYVSSASSTTTGFTPASTTTDSFTQPTSAPSPSFSSSVTGAATALDTMAFTSETLSGLSGTTNAATTMSGIAPPISTGTGGGGSSFSTGELIATIVGAVAGVVAVPVAIYFGIKMTRQRNTKKLHKNGQPSSLRMRRLSDAGS